MKNEKRERTTQITLYAFFLLLLLTAGQSFAAAVSPPSTLEELNQQVKAAQEKTKKIELQIEVYKKNIAVKQKEAKTLKSQLSVLESRLEKAALDLAVTQAKISELGLAVQTLGQEISLKERKIAEQKKLLAGLINNLYLKNQKNYLEVILTAASFADYFDEQYYLGDLSAKIDQQLNNIKKSREELALEKAEVEKRLGLIEDFKRQLKERQLALEEEKQAREFLLKETKSSEIKFKILLEQLRAENESLNREAAKLQREIEKRLGKNLPKGALGWPADSDNGFSASFHDPAYPFRYLFEHSGLDIRLPQGTPVKAAAPGYAAWTKTNRFYGNNVLIVHADNLATLYAHLSKFNVAPDTLVERGQIIGWSGGLPGTPGAGLSTGPHLHFEVRVSGEPQDPLNYLPK